MKVRTITDIFQRFQNPIKFEIGQNLHENRRNRRGVTALLLYQILTRYFKPFMNYDDLKIRNYIRTPAKNYLCRRFRPF